MANDHDPFAAHEPEERGNPMDAVRFEDLGREGDGEEKLVRCMAHFGVSEKKALEILEWAEENSPATTSRVHDPIKKMVSLEVLFRWLLAKKNGNLAVKAAAYALGLDRALNHKGPARWGREMDCERENANKLVKQIQQKLGLQPRKGQRTSATCEKQSDVRKSKLKHEPK